jgi:hypothetical protein
MRYLPFALWAAITVVLIAMSLSSFLFGSLQARQLAINVVLALVWPIALLSGAGRQALLQMGKSV